MDTPTLKGFSVFPMSVTNESGALLFLARDDNSREKLLGSTEAGGFEGIRDTQDGMTLFETSHQNCRKLSDLLPKLQPVSLGTRTSFGFGDRLGLATPGHVRAIRMTGVAPIFAQQSVRENNRTGRSPKEVLDDAVWGLFQEGWSGSWGADADHLKRPDDIRPFVEAGYTFYTVDPGDYVDDSAENASGAELAIKCEALPWNDLESSRRDLTQAYEDKEVKLDGHSFVFDRATLFRAAAKYGAAVAHVVRMYRRLIEIKGKDDFDFEVSVDETASPTSIAEHFWVASELRRLGVHWVSLAPRFVGRFEKGVDYIGNLQELERNLSAHCAVMHRFGNYKLSLHSGSDKLSVYPMIARLSGDKVHVKTAGTSYLEALRTLAFRVPDLFREILAFSAGRYEVDRATYHVSASLERLPDVRALGDEQLPSILEQFDSREILHVTYGSVLDEFRDELGRALTENEGFYTSILTAHFEKHLEALQGQSRNGR